MHSHVRSVGRGHERPAATVAEAVLTHAPAYIAANRLSSGQWRVLYDVVGCRKPAMGAHKQACVDCGYERLCYNSCRNRHCPQCQGMSQADWVEARCARMLPVPHFQVVFTLPAELRPLARQHPKVVYDLLFRAGVRTLKLLAKQRLGVESGITAVLHTWTREMAYHPHLHCVMTAGGLSLDGTAWGASRKRYLFPQRVMQAIFRGIFVAALLRAREAGELDVPGKLLGSLKRQKRWVVHVEAPQDRPVSHIVKYLARYVFRVAISDARVVAADAASVTIRTRGRQTIRLAGGEFVRRFLLHVLPSGFRKVRHFGLYAPGAAATKREKARSLLPTPAPAQTPDPACPVAAERAFSRTRCPECNGETLRLLVLTYSPPASARAPP